MASNLELMRAIWNTSSPTFRERIPEPSQTNMEQIGVLLGQDNYKAQRNEIFDALVNLIGKQKVLMSSLTNPLSMFKSGTMYLGDTYEEIMSDIIQAETFKIGEDDMFKKAKVNVKSAYHRINREDFYKVTIEETKLPRAFRNENGLQNLINSIINQMYSSNDLDEFLYTKETIKKYYTNTDVPILETQKVTVPDISANPLDVDNIKTFLITVKAVLKSMRFAKSIYNPLQFTLEVKPSDMIIIMRSDLTVVNEVSNLSSAFHPQFMDVNIPIIEIDEFAEGMENVQAVAMDKKALKIFDTLRTTRQVENAQNLYRNYFYHVHQLYSFSPFMSCVFFETE